MSDAFKVPGFPQVLLAFVVTDCILNTIVTFMASLLSPLGYGTVSDDDTFIPPLSDSPSDGC